ncbi:hypothetical protein N0V83_005444 [Neocucurbitaria cava]|uniref:Uncharacterized protein n=1 Tax=Neocucurbitaria cava TaxID=798079 RepID=A0A9W8Y7E0_9PLEO|nr:hypothetical protein N0V83_005444 [Neocucurbitaria cava]
MREETAEGCSSLDEGTESGDQAVGFELCRVRSRQPSPDHKDGFLDIALTSNPDSIVLRRVRYAMLAAFCSAAYIQRYVARRPDGSEILMLPAGRCEPRGLKTAIRWMELAYNGESECVLPRQFHGSDLDACYAERAFAVLGLHRKAKHIRLNVNGIFFTHGITVEFLQAVLETLPRRSHWVKKVLGYIRRCHANYSKNGQRNGNLLVCNVCGVSILESSSVHSEPEGLVEFVEWAMRDETFRKAVVGTYKTSRDAHLHVDIAADSFPATVSRTETWIMNVEDHESHPFGQFPDTSDLIGDVTKRIPTYRRGSGSECIYGLEWSERDGGCYIETYSSRREASSTFCEMQATEMSREWLASRGYRSKSADFGSIRSAPPGLREGSDQPDRQEKMATPKIRALSF